MIKTKPTKPVAKLTTKRWRPTYSDLAALEVLTDKLKIEYSNVIRLALHRMVDFEGVREQVSKKATLLKQMGA